MNASVLLSVGGLLFLLSLFVQVYALVDAVRQPPGALDGRGGPVLWVALLALGLLAPGAGLVLAGVYLLAVRPRTRA